LPEVTVGIPAEDELLAFARQHRRTYNWTQERYDDELTAIGERRADLRIVRIDGRVAGGLTLIPMGQWFGGRSVPTVGIGGVGVDPQERASGLASALMRGTLEELHASGCALSTLYPATQPVYRRAGYELAGWRVTYSLDANLIDVRDRSLPIEVCDPVEPDPLAPIYTARAQRTNGNLDRSEQFWGRIVDNPKGDVQAYLVGDGEGYVVFKQVGHWGYDLELRDVVALTPTAGRRLLTFFADHRSFAKKVKWNGPIGDPLAYHLREQHWNVDEVFGWMVRIVDIERALAERGYASTLEAELHLHVSDDVLPGNDGDFVLQVSGGKAQVTRGGRGSLRLDVRGLSPLYTAHQPAEALVALGLAEGTDSELALATTVFAGPAPWLADSF
jgi:predicted acetyltransferase